MVTYCPSGIPDLAFFRLVEIIFRETTLPKGARRLAKPASHCCCGTTLLKNDDASNQLCETSLPSVSFSQLCAEFTAPAGAFVQKN